MTALAKAKKIGASSITAISEAELTCRIVEAAANIKRRPELTAEQLVASMDEEDRIRWTATARAAMEYWRECIQQMQQTN
jgi:coenzyme F420-reducing hydrogenase delta subunit